MASSNPSHQALHVVAGHFAAQSLRQALQPQTPTVLTTVDELACGPALGAEDLELWQRNRRAFHSEVYLDARLAPVEVPHDTELLNNLAQLAEADQVVLWVGRALNEQLLLAWITFLFGRMRLDVSKLRVVQFDNIHRTWPAMFVGEMNPDEIRRLHPGSRPLGTGEIDELKRAWSAHTSSDPSALPSFLAQPSTLHFLHEAMRQLLYRYPDLRTGLSIWDEVSLRHTIEYGPLPARVVGYTMGAAETPDMPGDGYLYYRLRRLGAADLPAPLVSFTGDIRDMRGCSVEITDFGRKVLAGEANHVEANGIDDWIGGVHLTPDTVVFRDGDTLLLE